MKETENVANADNDDDTVENPCPLCGTPTVWTEDHDVRYSHWECPACGCMYEKLHRRAF